MLNRTRAPATKDPDKVRAGQIGARNRWGPYARVVRLDSLDSNERNAVLTLVRLFGTKKTAAACDPEAVSDEVRRDRAASQ